MLLYFIYTHTTVYVYELYVVLFGSILQAKMLKSTHNTFYAARCFIKLWQRKETKKNEKHYSIIAQRLFWNKSNTKLRFLMLRIFHNLLFMIKRQLFLFIVPFSRSREYLVFWQLAFLCHILNKILLFLFFYAVSSYSYFIFLLCIS